MHQDRSTPKPGRQRAVEPIAIVGMACRFPGASNPSALWRMLCAGQHALREVPADRWRAADFVDADRRATLVAVPTDGGLHFDLRLQGERETVFHVW